MTIIIKSDGTFKVEGKLEKPVLSKSGKSYIVASTSGFLGVTDDKGNQFKVALNIIIPKTD